MIAVAPPPSYDAMYNGQLDDDMYVTPGQAPPVQAPVYTKP